MSICRASRVALPLLLLASACADFEPGAPHASVHVDSQAPQRPPVIPSKPLEYKLHSPNDRKPIRALLAGPRRITQKVLLLTADENQPSYLAARDALVRMGVPFQAINAVNQEVTDALLTDQVSTCNFNAVLFATSGLGYWDATLDAWTSALTPEEWQRIASFETSCSAREAVWYAWPSPDLGLTYVSAFTSDDTVTGVVANPAFFKRVPATAQLTHEYAAGYRAAVTDATTTPIITDTAGNVLLATHTRPAGSEVMTSTVDSSPYLPHALALEYDMIRWLTHGMFIGEKHTYIAAQIDDLFLSNDMWRLDLHANPEDDTHTFRIAGTDLTKLVTWQQGLKARLPAGSSFITTMAFNGVGTTTDYTSDRTLLKAARNAGGKPHQLNHTRDHENMDDMSKADAKSEVQHNCNKARNLGLAGFSCLELVTPDMSGLGNLAAVQGMIAAGARSVVSDTSHVASDPRFADNPGDNPSFNVGRVSALDSRLYQIPRHPTNVFYDVMDPTGLVDSYNTRYPGSLTYAEIRDLNASYPLLYLLQGDIDPLMFHQANLAAYDGTHSLYGDFIDTLMNKYLALSTAPVVTLTQRAIAEEMKQRAAFDACNATAVIVESSSGRSLELSSSAACTIPVTGVSGSGAIGGLEIYAGDSITSVTMPTGGGTVTLAL
jgi:hypothetical protein